MNQAPFVQTRLGDGTSWTTLRRLTTCGLICIYRIISSGIQNTVEYNNKPLMSLILRFITDQMVILEGINTMYEINRLETEQCGSTSVQLVQLPTHSNIPDVSMVRNTGTVEHTRESERCSSTSIQLVQLPTHSEDQYRPMTPGEEEIMRIYEDGIYRVPDLIERTGGFWITGRSSPLLESAVIALVDMIDPELDELLRGSSAVVCFDQLRSGDPRARESFGRTYRTPQT